MSKSFSSFRTELNEAGFLSSLGSAVKSGIGSITKPISSVVKKSLPVTMAKNFSRGASGALPIATRGVGGRFTAPTTPNKMAWAAGSMATKAAKPIASAVRSTASTAASAGKLGGQALTTYAGLDHKNKDNDAVDKTTQTV